MTTKDRIAPQDDARRRRIAGGVIQGKSLATIACEEGVSRQTIRKQSAADDVRQDNSRRGQRRAGQNRPDARLGVIEEAFDARLIRLGKDGELVDLGPDHYARLTAVDWFIKLLTAGRPVPKAVELTKGGETMMLAEREARVVGKAGGREGAAARTV